MGHHRPVVQMDRSATAVAGLAPAPTRSPTGLRRSSARSPRSSAGTPSSTPSVSTSCAPPSTDASTPSGNVYLDYTGGSLYAESQLEEHLRMLRDGVSATRTPSTRPRRPRPRWWSSARAAVLRYFNAPESEYACIFTPNATGALRLVGEAYPFDRAAGSSPPPTTTTRSTASGSSPARAGADDGVRAGRGARCASTRPGSRTTSTTAAGRPTSSPIPAQSNFSGVKHPLEWIDAGPRAGLGRAPGLRRVRADEPARPRRCGSRTSSRSRSTRCSATRRASGALLVRGAGARAPAAAVVQRRHRRRRERSGRLARAARRPAGVRGRHGGLPRHPGGRDRPAPPRADRHRHDRAARRDASAAWLLEAAAALRHSDGSPAIRIYGPRRRGTAAGARSRSTSCTRTGGVVDERLVDRVAAEHNISLRTGCFCNPGSAELVYDIPPETLLRRTGSPSSSDHLRALGIESGGAVRVSLGVATTFRDVYRFMRFASTFGLQTTG